jgi:serine/threonine protein kinase/tetratricopeptide (TPR) repeat protein
MLILPSLSALAITPLLKGLMGGAVEFGSERAVVGVTDFLVQRFTDTSSKLPLALQRASNQAWRAFEIALAGESLWSWLDKGDNKAFRQEVRSFLDEAEEKLPNLPKDFRKKALKELQEARKGNILLAGRPAEDTAKQAASFSRFADPQAMIDAEWQLIGQIAANLRNRGYENLAVLLGQKPMEKGPPLLAMAVRFFFRREIESNPELFQGLMYEQVDQIGQNLLAGFKGVQTALDQKGKELVGQLQSIEVVVKQTHEAVLDVREEVQKQGQQHRELYEAVLKLHHKLDVSVQEVRAKDSLSIRNDEERRLVKEVVSRYRTLPQQERQELPALLNAIGKLEVAAGDYAAAQKDFEKVSTLVQAPAARGEAHFNAYHALLEQGKFAEALQELLLALQCDAVRFAPFPLTDYEPVRIIGAGGFGVTFQCKYRLTGGDVAVKSLLVDGLERDVNVVFQEASMLDQIHHPAIVQLRACGFADPARTRPYLVMNYFDGVTLEEHVRRHGPLSPANFLAVARPVAEALQAAHAHKILHRDIKPANLLVRFERGAWDVKVIDFGLALKQSVLISAGTTTRQGQTIAGASIAGTIDYAAPEQMGKLPGVAIGPTADIFGFGKTSCYALFQTPAPTRSHWQKIPDSLGQLLEDCLQENPKNRLGSFAALLKRLSDLRKGFKEDLPEAKVIPTVELAPEITPPPLTPLPPRPVPEAPVILQAAYPRTYPPPRHPTPPRIPIPQDRYEDDDWEDQRDRRRRRVERSGISYQLPVVLSGFLGACICGVFLGLGMLMDAPPGNDSPLFMLLGGLIIGGLIGFVGGSVIRSIRGWIFVLATTGIMSVLVMFADSGPSIPVLGLIGVFIMFAWIVALPIKGVMYLIKQAQ